MPKDVPSTRDHRPPVRPVGRERRAALVCAFPRPFAIPLPESGKVVGRSWLEDHGLADSEVSTSHTKIDRRGGALRVADAGSRNGTWLNGVRLGPRDLTPLEDGGVLRIGRTLFVFREGLVGGFEPAPPLGALVAPFGVRAVAEVLSGLSKTDARNVLVLGETGVGKELVARAVAAALGRDKIFAAVNVAGVARGVFESQMFGHVAGAFSDARSAAPGIAVTHDGGTLFLDEIGELALDLQAKLLRLVENREVLPVGASRAVHVDVATVAATNQNLEDMVERGTFRRDLLARLAMVSILVPPLRERAEDLFSVASELSRRAGHGFATDDVEVEAMERLLLEPWPSNVRGLDAALAAARRADPSPGLRRWALDKVLGEVVGGKLALTEETLERALDAANGNVSEAASRLGVSRGKLLRFRKRTP
jgi:MoxR-like ATPase